MPRIDQCREGRVSVSRSFFVLCLLLVGAVLFTPRTAAAQGCQQVGCDQVPPVVTPTFDATLVPLDTMRITWCDNEWLMPATRTITLNGSNVVGNFTYSGASGSCASQAISIGTLTLSPGTTYTLFATIEDEHGNIGTGSVDYTAPNGWIAVNPKGLGVSKPQQSSNLTQAFVVKNPNSTANNYRLVRTCTGQVSSCSAVADTIHLNGGDSTTVSVTYNTGLISSGPTGTIRLRARMTTDTTVADSADVTVSLISSLIVDDSPTNFDAQNMRLCAYSCFANIYSHSTVPYFSLDQPRSVTLVNNHIRVWERPYLLFNLSAVAGSPALTRFKLTVRDSATGGAIRVQGDNTGSEGLVTFWPGTGTVRLGTHINDNTWLASHSTGIHPVKVIVTALRTGFADEVDTVVVPVLVVREPPGAVARGWYVEGIQRLIPTSGGRVIVAESDGSAFVFTAADTLGSYQAPSGEFSRLSRSGSGVNAIYTRAYSDSSKVRFNYQGQMMDASDSWGKKIRYAYNASGQPTRIYDPFRTRPDSTAAPSAYTELVYFADSVLIRPPQADGSPNDASRVTKLRITADSVLRAVVDPDGDSTRFTYKAGITNDVNRKVYLETVYNRNGTLSRTFIYDVSPGGSYFTGSMKLLTTKADTIATYTSWGNTTNSAPTTTGYDWRGRGIAAFATTFAVPGLPAYPIDSLAHSDVRDPGQHQSFGIHDRWGQFLKFVTHNLKDTTKYFRTGLFADSVRNPIGTVDRFTYTLVAGGRPALASSTPAGQSTTNYHYDALGQVDSISSVTSPTVGIGRSGGNPAHIEQVSVAGIATTYTYDSWGRMKQSIDHLNHSTEIFFDDTFGNTRKVLYEGTRFDSVRVDAYGRDSILMSTTASKRILTYDVLNRAKRDSVAGAGAATAYTYDKQFLIRVVDPKGQIFKREVNALGWTRKVFDPADTTKFVLRNFSVEGLPRHLVNRRGQWKEWYYTADDNRHLVTSVLSDSSFNMDSITYAYTTSGGVRTGTLVAARNSFAHDSIWSNVHGRVDSAVTRIRANRGSGWSTDSVGRRRYVRRYSWSSDGLLTSVNLDTRTTSGGTLLRSYTPRNYWWNDTTRALDSISLTGVLGSAKVVRDFEGKDSTWTFPSAGLSATVLATKRHEPWLQSYSVPAIDSVLRRGYAYTDIAGRLMEINSGLGTISLRPFRYSPKGDLSWLSDLVAGQECETFPGSSGADVDGFTCSPSSPTTTRTLGLEYDAARNLRKQVDSVSMAIDTAIVAVGNRVTSWGSTTYAFDADGNMITRTSGGVTTNFAYDGDGMLRRTIVGTDTTCYDYNAFNQLILKSTHGCRYVSKAGGRTVSRIYLWDGDQIMAEVDSLGTTRFAEYTYRPGIDRPHALLSDSGGTTIARFYHQDMMGNVIGLTRGTSLAQTLEYEPWGELTASTGTLADTSRLRWKGLYWEGGNTNLYYLRNRWYDPQARRFTSEDPIGIDGGMNLYTFAGNDWVNRADPYGLKPGCIPVWYPPVSVSKVGGGVAHTPGRWGCLPTTDEGAPPGGPRVPVDPYDDAAALGGPDGRPSRLQRLRQLGASYCSAARKLNGAIYSGGSAQVALGWGLGASGGVYASPSEFGVYVRGAIHFGLEGSFGPEVGASLGSLGGVAIGAGAGGGPGVERGVAGSIGVYPSLSLGGSTNIGAGVPVSASVSVGYTHTFPLGTCASG